MRRVKLDAIARQHLREIRAYSTAKWGVARADAYIRDLSTRFEDIAAGRSHSRAVAAIFAVEGHYCRCGQHFIYWRPIGRDTIAIVAILHQRMHQRDRIRAAFDESR